MPGGSEHGNVLSQGSGGRKPQITVWTGPCPAETWGGRVSSPPSSFWQWPCILVPVTASPRPSSRGLLPAPVSSSKDTVVLAPGPPQRHHVFQDSTSNSGHVHLSFCGGGGTIPRHWWDELGPWASDSFGDHLLLSISRRFPSRAPHLRGACEVTRKSLARLPGSRSATSHPPPPAPFLGHPPPTIHTSWAPGPASSHQVRCRGDLVPWGSSHTLGTDAN